MKRLFALLLTIAVVGIPTGAYASSETELLNAVRTTFAEDISGNGSYEFSADAGDKSFFSGSSAVTYKYHKGDWESHGDTSISFDTSVVAGLFPEPIPVLSGVLAFGQDAFYNHQEKFLWAKLRDSSLNISKDESGMNIKAIAEGLFEFTKFFTDKYVVIDFPTAIEDISDNNPVAAEIRSQLQAMLAIYDNYGDFTADSMKILLDAGIFEVNKDRSQYIITLADTPDNLHLEKLADFMTLVGAPEDEIKTFTEMITDENESIRQAWPEIVKNIGLTIRFNTNSNKVSLVSIDLAVTLPSEISGADSTGETPATPFSFSVSGNMSLSDAPERISFPTETRFVDVAKFLKGVAALLDQSFAL